MLSEFQLWDGELEYIDNLLEVRPFNALHNWMILISFPLVQVDIRNNSAWNQVIGTLVR